MNATSPASAPSSPASTGESPSTTSAAQPAEKKWNKFDEPRPYVTVSGLVMNRKGEIVLLHRSAKVRSARNCWSLPSGLHEVGLSMRDQFAQEIREELNLVPIPEKSCMIGLYENIRPDGAHALGWHWVIAVMAMRVESFTPLVNREPDKHDQIEIVNIVQDWITSRQWAPKLGEFLVENRTNIRNSANYILSL